jgi:ParB family chromosome partitioning protein
MDNKKTGLGKGLSALFTEKNIDINSLENEPAKDAGTNFVEIEIDKISVNPHQPREDFDPERLKELAESIKSFGIVQPVTVTPAGEGYMLISGERRIRASQMAGLKTIPAYIRKDHGKDNENLLELALIENIQREDLNPMELSNSYQRLIDEVGLTQEQISEKVSKQRSTIANYLRLQRLPQEIKASLRKNEITEGHARSILRLENPEEQVILWKRILEENLTVRKVEEITRPSAKSKKKKKESKGIEEWNPYFEKLEDKMRKFFGTRVKVKSKTKTSGEIVVEYYSNDDLERIMEKFD